MLSYTTLITNTELGNLLASSTETVVLDCQASIVDPGGGRAAYLDSHLPGACHGDLDTDFADVAPAARAEGGRHPLPERQHLLGRMRAWGINNDTQVVAYDASGGVFAARAWWCLRWMGHARVAVLDGGMDACQALGNRARWRQ